MKKRLRDIKPILYTYQIYNILVFIPFLTIMTIFVASTIILFALINITMIRKPITKLWARSISIMAPMFVKVIGRV